MIGTFFRKPGDTANASLETSLQTEIGLETGGLTGDDVRTEAINRIHFQPTPGDVTTGRRAAASASGTSGTYASATYVPITHDVPMLLSPVADMDAGWTARFQWSMWVTEFEKAGNLGEYAFCLKLDTGSGFVQVSPDYWFSAMAYPIDGPSTSTYFPMYRRRHTMSFTYVAQANTNVLSARIDVKIVSPWTIDISYNNFFFIVQRH